jgi:hypothetical protein
MTSEGFEPVIPATKRPQTYALDRAATGIGKSRIWLGILIYLEDRAIEVLSPAEARDFSSNLCVQAGSGAHPASCTMSTGVLSPG